MAWVGQRRPGYGYMEGTVPGWSREFESAPSFSPAPGFLGFGERGLLTDDVDTDSTAFLGPMAGMGGYTAVGSLVLRSYLREEQHRVGGKGQGHALWGEGG